MVVASSEAHKDGNGRLFLPFYFGFPGDSTGGMIAFHVPIEFGMILRQTIITDVCGKRRELLLTRQVRM
jgi:hypothetical protein